MFCNMTQEYLADKGISFEKRDVTASEEHLKELRELGFATTPVTVIDGESVVGFDQERLDELLGL